MRRRGSSTGFLPAQREGHDAERPLQQHREGHPPSKRIRRTAPKSPGPRSPHPLRKREVSNRFRIWVAPRSRYALVPKRRDGSIFLWICKANLHAPVVGGDAGHSRSRRRSVTDVGLPLAGTHRPGRMDCFFGNLRQIRSCPAGRQSRRPLQRPALSPVGADDSVRPQDAPLFTEIFGEIATSRRADVGIAPYGTPANPYFPASFERKVFLQQILNRSYSQIWCTVTGGAYHSARRGSMCVRNVCKSDSCLNRTAECTKRVQALFSSLSFLLREKR